MLGDLSLCFSPELTLTSRGAARDSVIVLPLINLCTLCTAQVRNHTVGPIVAIIDIAAALH